MRRAKLAQLVWSGEKLCGWSVHFFLLQSFPAIPRHHMDGPFGNIWLTHSGLFACLDRATCFDMVMLRLRAQAACRLPGRAHQLLRRFGMSEHIRRTKAPSLRNSALAESCSNSLKHPTGQGGVWLSTVPRIPRKTARSLLSVPCRNGLWE